MVNFNVSEVVWTPGEHQCYVLCGNKPGACPGHCGSTGYCCSGEDASDPTSWLSKIGNNGDCPQAAIKANQNRADPFAGYACVSKNVHEGTLT